MKRRIPILAVAALLLAGAAVVAYLALRSPAPSPAGPAEPAAAGAVREAGLPSAPETLRIATYNIQSFGRTKLARTETLTVLARIGVSFDVLAVQEVGSNGSSAGEETAEAVMAGYAARMNALVGAEVYGYVRADQYGAVYRTDRLAVVGWRLYSGSEEFAYPPLAVAFRTIGAPLDFVLLVAHVRPSEAAREIPALARAMAETAAAYAEPDVLCAGDFNADGSYYDEGEGASLAGFPEPDFISVVSNDADTTVAPGALAYDRMVLARSLGEDFTGGWAVMRPGELWDLSACEGPAGRAGTESALSDHYPVWAEFYTRRDTD